MQLRLMYQRNVSRENRSRATSRDDIAYNLKLYADGIGAVEDVE